jgi:hypothetical protein
VKDIIDERFRKLVADGEQLVRRLPSDSHGLDYWVPSRSVAEYHAWLSAVANLVDLVTTPQSSYRGQVQKILAHENMATGIPTVVVQQLFGLLQAASADWSAGTLRRIEYIVAASTFDDFLDHAGVYHKGGKKIEASVLASAVLEDAIKKIAARNTITTSGQSLEQLIDALVAADGITAVKGKRIKSWSGVRNHALHAEWDKFDIKDVGMMIEGIRELLDAHL